MNQSWDDFEREVMDTFMFAVDGPHATTPSGRAKRRAFWERAHVRRDKEQREFRSFLRSDISLLCLPGRLGSGKSTWIHHMLDSTDNVMGVFLDMNRHHGQFRDEDALGTRSALHGIVRTVLRDVLTQEMLVSRLSGAAFNPGRPHHRARDTPTVTAKQAASKTLRRAAELCLAVEAAMLGRVSESLAEVVRPLDVFADTDEELRRQYEERMRQDPRLISRLLGAMSWLDWLNLLRCSAEADLVPVVVLDNMDRVDLRRIQDHIIESLLELSEEANLGPAPQDPAIDPPSPIKIVFVIRDENFSRIHISGGANTRISLISLGNPIPHPGGPLGRAATLQLDNAFAVKVLSGRLEWLADTLREDSRFQTFRALIQSYWFDDEESMIQDLGHANVSDMHDGSLRLILHTVASSALSMVQTYGESELRVVAGRPAIATWVLRGRVMRSLAETPASGECIDEMRKSYLREHKELHCCILRHVLTYLINWPEGNGRITMRQVVSRLNAVFGYEEDEVRRAIFTLYRTSSHEGELVSISQRRFVDNPQSIQLDARIACTRRGRAYIRFVMKNIDFMGSLFQVSAGGRVLAEMGPREALHYIREVYSRTVGMLSERHLQYFTRCVVPRLACSQESTPFDVYKADCTNGQRFFMSAVADSHRASIKRYLREMLRGPDSELVLSDEGRRELVELLPSSLLPDPVDGQKFLDDQIQSLVFALPQGHPARELWRLYQDYGERAERQQRASRMTRAQLEREFG